MKIKRLSLALIAVSMLATSGCAAFRKDASVPADEEPVAEPPAGPVIEPELDRRDVKRPRIDTEDWEISGFVGALSVEDFGTELIYGARLGYHVSEDIFLEGEYAWSEISDSNFRRIGAPLFDNEDEDLTSYSLSVGYNVLPGEVFVGSGWARASSMYITFGAGNTNFVGEDNVTFLAGFGLRTLISDWFSIRVEARDRIFESDLLGENEWKHNFEATLTLGVFF
ncbi:MAG: outer membrane beta-barrel domain-containing protein [Gammaproteobacteria bacterium]|jgi:outer membrane beta-barrel protein